MIKLTPILLAVLYALATYRFSVWRTHRELDAKSTELVDPQLRPLLDRLAAALELDRIPVYIYEIDPVNGLAAPDGRIFITRGFYLRMRSGEITPEEMSSVIAHEMGHVALGHAKRRMGDFAGQNALRTVLMMVFARYVPFVGPMIAQLELTRGQHDKSLCFSRTGGADHRYGPRSGRGLSTGQSRV